MITIRPANLDDAGLLLEWRNDKHSRQASRNQNVISLDAHIDWLQRVLGSDEAMVVIAEQRGVPVGSVRAEQRNGLWEMSWVLAPEARGKGLAKEMVITFRESLDGDVAAWVKEENVASIKIAAALGLTLQRIEDGFGYYS